MFLSFSLRDIKILIYKIPDTHTLKNFLSQHSVVCVGNLIFEFLGGMLHSMAFISWIALDFGLNWFRVLND